MSLHPYAQAFADRDLDAALELLADDVVFHSPVIAEPGFEGKAAVAELMKVVFERVTDEEYLVDTGDDEVHILVADATVLGKPIKATTLLQYDANAKIREIWVMARPLVGVVAIAEAIGSGLVGREAPGRGRVVRAASKPLAGLAAVNDAAGSRIVAALNRESA